MAAYTYFHLNGEPDECVNLKVAIRSDHVAFEVELKEDYKLTSTFTIYLSMAQAATVAELFSGLLPAKEETVPETITQTNAPE